MTNRFIYLERRRANIRTSRFDLGGLGSGERENYETMKRILFHLLVLAQQKLNSERRGSKTVIDDYDEKGLLTLLSLRMNIF